MRNEADAITNMMSWSDFVLHIFVWANKMVIPAEIKGQLQDIAISSGDAGSKTGRATPAGSLTLSPFILAEPGA